METRQVTYVGMVKDMEKQGRLIASIVILVFVAYSLLGLVGLLPAQYDATKGFKTELNFGDITEYPSSPNYNPAKIVYDSVNNQAWFIGAGSNSIGKITSDGTVTKFTIPESNANPQSLAIDNTGMIWFVTETHKLGSMTQAGVFGTMHGTFPYTYNRDVAYYSGSIYIAEGSDTGTNYITEYKISANTMNPHGITTKSCSVSTLTIDVSGNVWFTESASSKLGRMTQAYAFEEWDTPSTPSQAIGITVDNNGDIWFGEYGNDKIVKFTTSTELFKEHAIPTSGARPVGITTNAVTGDIWFTEEVANKIGRFKQDTQQITEYEIPTASSHPYGIVSDSSGDNIWFTEYFGNRIGKLYAPANRPITIDVIQAGQWKKGDTTEQYNYISTATTVVVNVQSEFPITSVKIVYATNPNLPAFQTNAMTLLSGDSRNGNYSYNIQALGKETNISYRIDAESLSGKISTQYYIIHIIEHSDQPATTSAFNTSQIIYAIIIVSLTALGIFFNRQSISGWLPVRKKGWNRRK